MKDSGEKKHKSFRFYQNESDNGASETEKIFINILGIIAIIVVIIFVITIFKLLGSFTI